MPALLLRRMDGSTELRELSRSQPLTIGRQSFNDICIPENDVAPMHCRISWNKSGFEVTAATTEGVDINSGVVAYSMLKPGDTIRVGSVDLVFQEETAVSQLSVKTDSTDSRRKNRHSERETSQEPTEKPVEEMSLYSGQIQTESQAVIDALFANDRDDDDDYSSDQVLKRPSSSPAARPSQQAVRPGEQEILKSPLVLGLAGGGLTLLLITGIFWFLIAREQTNRMYDRAVQELTIGQYSQSITTFERFIQQNPGHGLRRQAERGLAKALIQKEISGATPAWKRGYERLDELIKAHRNDSDFSDLHSTIFQYAEQISIGAAKAAETTREAHSLTVSKDAQVFLERYADSSAPPTATLGRISEQRTKAERAIQKQSTFDLAMKTVDAAISDRKPMTALSERERLVKGFPEFISSQRVKDALQKSLDLERSLVATDETERIANTDDEGVFSSEPILGLLHARSRTEETTLGRIAFVTAKESVYAIDPASGELVWRRVIGARTPFFPVTTNAAQASVLLFDTRNNSLLACQHANGKLIWRQPLKNRAISQPLVHDGQIYLPLDGHSLVRIDVETGRLSATVRFSQNLATTPVLSRDGNVLLVPGEMAMIYALTLRSASKQPVLSAVATTFTDHAAGSVSAPPLSMGRLLLLCENDLAQSAKLRLWDASRPNESLTELGSTPTVGQVRDVPVLRGNQLVVPSSGEQFAAFAVTDEVGRAGIAPIGQYRAEQAPQPNRMVSPLFVSLGSDGQFWSAGSAFRRFEIGSNSIRMDSNSTAPGIASQPLQAAGEMFLMGRKTRYSDAVTFSSIDREKLVTPWRIVLGDRPLEMAATQEGSIVWVGENGSLYAVGKSRMSQGGFDLRAGVDLDLPADISKPIQATLLPDQRLVVTAAGESIRLFVLNTAGQVVAKESLTDFPETDPVLWDEGLVFPLPSRLKLVTLSSGKKPPQDWIAPAGDNSDRIWKYLIRVSGRELIGCDDSGRLTRVQYRTGDVPHLAGISEFQLEHPIEVRPFLRGESLYIADATGSVRQLNVPSFDTDGQTAFASPIRNMWPVGVDTIVQAGDKKLHCLADGKTLPEQWAFELAQLEPTGPMILKESVVWFACRDGTVIALNAKTGVEVRRIVLPQSLSLGLRPIQESLFAVAVDGTLYRVE